MNYLLLLDFLFREIKESRVFFLGEVGFSGYMYGDFVFCVLCVFIMLWLCE